MTNTYMLNKKKHSSLVPLVSKVCPSDVYRVWKSGSCLRVDTTLLGFEHMTWLKGRRSYIFKGGGVYASETFLCPLRPTPSSQALFMLVVAGAPPHPPTLPSSQMMGPW